jgi:hypothetical protein
LSGRQVSTSIRSSSGPLGKQIQELSIFQCIVGTKMPWNIDSSWICFPRGPEGRNMSPWQYTIFTVYKIKCAIDWHLVFIYPEKSNRRCCAPYGYKNVVWQKWNKALFISTFRIHHFGLEYEKKEAHAEILRYIFDEMEDSGVLELCSPYSADIVIENLI